MTGIGYGGASKSLLLLLKSLKLYSDIEVFVFTQFSNSPEIKNEIENYCKKLIIIDYPHINANQAYSTSIKEFRRIISANYDELINQINTLNPDIVHINSTTLAYLIKPLKEINPQLKTVIHLREVVKNSKTDEVANFLIFSIKHFADHKIAISDNELIPFDDLKNFTILPNPINFDEIKFESKKKVVICSQNVTIGMMASFHPSKGHFNFLRTLLLLQKKSKNFSGIILGVKMPSPNTRYYIKRFFHKDFYTNLIKYISKNKLLDNVQLVNQTNTVSEFWDSLDIYVRPSDAGDPWGRDIIEAMAMKKPIVATGSSTFFVEEGKTGYLVPPKNPRILAERIMHLIENPQKRLTFGEAGHIKVKNMCDLKDYGSKIHKIYSDLLEVQNMESKNK